MRMSTLLDPPFNLGVKDEEGSIDRDRCTDEVVLSATNWVCSCEKDWCPVAVPIYCMVTQSERTTEKRKNRP